MPPRKATGKGFVKPKPAFKKPATRSAPSEQNISASGSGVVPAAMEDKQVEAATSHPAPEMSRTETNETMDVDADPLLAFLPEDVPIVESQLSAIDINNEGSLSPMPDDFRPMTPPSRTSEVFVPPVTPSDDLPMEDPAEDEEDMEEDDEDNQDLDEGSFKSDEDDQGESDEEETEINAVFELPPAGQQQVPLRASKAGTGSSPVKPVRRPAKIGIDTMYESVSDSESDKETVKKSTKKQPHVIDQTQIDSDNEIVDESLTGDDNQEEEEEDGEEDDAAASAVVSSDSSGEEEEGSGKGSEGEEPESAPKISVKRKIRQPTPAYQPSSLLVDSVQRVECKVVDGKLVETTLDNSPVTPPPSQYLRKPTRKELSMEMNALSVTQGAEFVLSPKDVALLKLAGYVILPWSKIAPNAITATVKPQKFNLDKMTEPKGGGHNTLADDFYTWGVGNSTTICDGLVKFPFDILENITFTSLALRMGVQVLFDTDALNLSLAKLAGSHASFADEARDREFMRDVYIKDLADKKERDKSDAVELAHEKKAKARAKGKKSISLVDEPESEEENPSPAKSTAAPSSPTKSVGATPNASSKKPTDTKGPFYTLAAHESEYVWPFEATTIGIDKPRYKNNGNAFLSGSKIPTYNILRPEYGRLYGRNETDLPPWVTVYIRKWLSGYYSVIHSIVLKHAGAHGHTVSTMTYQRRVELAKAKTGAATNQSEAWGQEIHLSAAEELFGSAAVIRVGGALSWATGIEGEEDIDEDQPPVDDDDPVAQYGLLYKLRVTAAMRSIVRGVTRAEGVKINRLIGHDNHIQATWSVLAKKFNAHKLALKTNSSAPCPLSMQELASFAPSLIKDSLKYREIQGIVPPYFDTFIKNFFAQALVGSELDSDAISLLTPPERVNLESLKNTINQFEQTSMVDEEVSGQLKKVQEIDGANVSDLPQAPPPTSFLLDPSAGAKAQYGVEFFSKMDPVDIIVYLGLEEYQEKSTWREARLLTDKKYHEYEKNADHSPKLDLKGQIIFKHPRERKLRTEVLWPFFLKYDNTSPIDSVAWEQMVLKNPRISPSATTHHPLRPKWHQLVAVAVILARGYCHFNPEQHQPSNYWTLLSDEMGLGKTWVAWMLMTALKALRLRHRNKPSSRPPVFDAYKEAFHIGPIKRHLLKRDFLDSLPVDWVGDVRAGINRSPNKTHMFVASKSVIAQQFIDAQRCLDTHHFHVVDYTDFRNDSENERRKIWESISNSHIAGKEVVICIHYQKLVSEAKVEPNNGPTTLNHSRPQNIFHPSKLYTTVMVDEAAEIRNPTSGLSYSVRRLSEHSEYIITATATPIYSSPNDLLAIGEAVGSPLVIARRLDREHLPDRVLTAGDGSKAPRKRSRTDFSHYRSKALDITIQWSQCKEALQKAKKDIFAIEQSSNASPVKLEKISSASMLSWHEEYDYNPNNRRMEVAVHAFQQAASLVMLNVVDPLRTLFAPVIIRRTHQSLGFDGLTLTDIKEVIPEVIMVVQPEDQARAYQNFLVSGEAEDVHFMIELRRWLIEPHGAGHGYWNPQSSPSAAVSGLIEKITSVLLEDHEKPIQEQRKIIVYSSWTSLVLLVQTHLVKAGIFSSSYHGKLSNIERARMITEFQQDADHPPTIISEPTKGGACLTFKPKEGHGARVMFITQVGAFGLTLTRGSVVILLDPVWTWAEVQQIVGRANRFGQTREVTAHVIIVKDTIEEKMWDTCRNKKMLGGGFNDDIRQAGKAELLAQPSGSPPSESVRVLHPSEDTNDKDRDKEESRMSKIITRHLDVKHGVIDRLSPPHSHRRTTLNFMYQEIGLKDLRGQPKRYATEALARNEYYQKKPSRGDLDYDVQQIFHRQISAKINHMDAQEQAIKAGDWASLDKLLFMVKVAKSVEMCTPHHHTIDDFDDSAPGSDNPRTAREKLISVIERRFSFRHLLGDIWYNDTIISQTDKELALSQILMWDHIRLNGSGFLSYPACLANDIVALLAHITIITDYPMLKIVPVHTPNTIFSLLDVDGHRVRHSKMRICIERLHTSIGCTTFQYDRSVEHAAKYVGFEAWFETHQGAQRMLPCYPEHDLALDVLRKVFRRLAVAIATEVITPQHQFIVKALNSAWDAVPTKDHTPLPIPYDMHVSYLFTPDGKLEEGFVTSRLKHIKKPENKRYIEFSSMFEAVIRLAGSWDPPTDVDSALPGIPSVNYLDLDCHDAPRISANSDDKFPTPKEMKAYETRRAKRVAKHVETTQMLADDQTENPRTKKVKKAKKAKTAK